MLDCLETMVELNFCQRRLLRVSDDNEFTTVSDCFPTSLELLVASLELEEPVVYRSTLVALSFKLDLVTDDVIGRRAYHA